MNQELRSHTKHGDAQEKNILMNKCSIAQQKRKKKNIVFDGAEP